MTAAKEHLTIISPAYTDLRGEISNILSGSAVEIAHVAIITCHKGAVRGNHYHPSDEQWMYLISGEYLAFAQAVKVPPMGTPLHATPPLENFLHSLDGSQISAQTVKAGQLAYCPPGVAHAYLFTEESMFLNLTPKPRIAGKPEESQIAYPLIIGGAEASGVSKLPVTQALTFAAQKLAGDEIGSMLHQAQLEQWQSLIRETLNRYNIRW